MSTAKRKLDALIITMTLLMENAQGVSIAQVQEAVGCDYSSAYRYLQDLGATNPQRGLWQLAPQPGWVRMARAILACVEEN